jgi:hypothetical protein
VIGRAVAFGAVGVVGAAGAALADRWLARRSGSGLPPSVDTLIVIDAPLEHVWTWVSDIDRQPLWMHEMKSVRLLTPPPVRVGTRAEATVRILGISVTDPVTIAEWSPPRRFAVRHEGLFTGGGVIELEPGADGTTTIVRWSETLIAPVLPHLAAAVQYPVFAAVFQNDLHTLRGLVEADA